MVRVRRRPVLLAAFLLCCGAEAIPQTTDPAAESHRAKEFMAAGRFAEAVPIYESLLKSFPGNPGLLLNLGLAEQMSGHPARAVPEFESVLKVEPDSLPALLSLSKARLDMNQSRLAIDPLRKAIKLAPDNVPALSMLAEAEMNSGLLQDAAGHYRALLQRNDTDPRAWYGLGKTYESLAARTFDRLAQTAPQSPYVAILVADTRLQRHQYRSAFFFYRDAQTKLPDVPGLHAGLAEVYGKTGHADWAAAEKQKEAALPKPDCKSQTAECAYLSQNYDEVIRDMAPNASQSTLFWAAKAYNELATRAFEKLSALPESVEIHALKAQILHDHKRDKEAAEEWRAAQRLAPDDPSVARELAAALFDAKDYDSAIPLIKQQLATESDSPDMNYLMGASLFRTEKAEEALPFLQRAVQKRPNNAAACGALGLALLSLNRGSDAIPYLKRALELDDDGSLHYSLARAYRAAGETQLAARAMQDYQKIQQRNQEINEKVAKEAEITAP